VALVGKSHVLFVTVSRAAAQRGLTRERSLEIVNELNADPMYITAAFIDEDNAIVFKRALPVGGGLPEANFIQTLLEFFVECLLHDALIRQR